MTAAPDLIPIARRLARETSVLRFAPPVAFVYAPLDYARRPHEAFLALARPRPEALLLGMNPGPWGMAQTGVPFGEVAVARDWLGLAAPVGRPDPEHPKRPVLGYDCRRSEVSGRRLWGWARDRFGTPARFFATFFVWNYCPLAFLEASGRNRTPDQLPAAEREPLFAACDRALAALVGELRPRRVIGVGAFAAARARNLLGDAGPAVGSILHPSPASPAANRGWEAAAEGQLAALGVPMPARRGGTR